MWRNYVLWLRESLGIAGRDEELYDFEPYMAAVVTALGVLFFSAIVVLLGTIVLAIGG